ncbi:dihydroorotate dehydrogenase [Spiractinospora alimapuensis]|uniref:dihydroorotate dehydrogenase n=1 Tax=Spiractinospora alimapuensis TaxID=2820884 RepID=UPI001EEC7CFF|nr:dihydroorotate dehydrogenase [Spiractinospora alimapuensis]QVQ53200.1 dihydroorotate dehydrogenase [Spiractinospora alimapuensis]
MRPDLTVRLGSWEAPNPVLTAAGCAGTGRELAPFCDLSRIGAVTTKSVMIEPRAGNPMPRMAETPSGMVSALGLQGPGIDVLVQRDLPWLVSQGARAIVSLAGSGPQEYSELAHRLDGLSICAVEVNLSCVNPASQGRRFAHEPAEAAAVVRAVRDATAGDVPVFAKLAVDGVDLRELAEACVTAGADGLSLINTVRGLAVNIDTRRLAVAGGSEQGGLSGPAIRPIALAAVHDVHATVPDVPIIGMGGVRSGTDVMEFMLAGASAVAVGTAIVHDPGAGERILREFTEGLERRGIERAADLVGAAHGGNE